MIVDWVNFSGMITTSSSSSLLWAWKKTERKSYMCESTPMATLGWVLRVFIIVRKCYPSNSLSLSSELGGSHCCFHLPRLVPRLTQHLFLFLDSQVDKSLDEWPEDDWRLFVGDLGNEVTEDLLARPFSKVYIQEQHFYPYVLHVSLHGIII